MLHDNHNSSKHTLLGAPPSVAKTGQAVDKADGRGESGGDGRSDIDGGVGGVGGVGGGRQRWEILDIDPGVAPEDISGWFAARP